MQSTSKLSQTTRISFIKAEESGNAVKIVKIAVVLCLAS